MIIYSSIASPAATISADIINLKERFDFFNDYKIVWNINPNFNSPNKSI